MNCTGFASGLTRRRQPALEARRLWDGIELLAARNRALDDHVGRKAERLIFHTNDNTASATISFSDLERFLATRGNTVRCIEV